MNNVHTIIFSKKTLVFSLLLGLGMSMCLISNTSALSRTYFDDAGDDAGDCDVGKPSYQLSNYNDNNCDPEHRIVLLAGENNKVPKERTVLQANFKNGSITEKPQNQSIIIRGAHLCAGNSNAVLGNSRDAVINGYYSDNTKDTPNPDKIRDDKLYNKDVTQYLIGSHTRHGKFRHANTNDCSAGPNITINLNDDDFQAVDTENAPGWWFVKIIVTHKNQHGAPNACQTGSNTGTGGPCDGLVNSFRISAVGDKARTVTSYSTDQACGLGECVTLRSADGVDSDDYDHYLTFKLRFGSDCSLETPQPKDISFYDLDYGINTDGGRHIIKFTMRGEWPELQGDGSVRTVVKWWWDKPADNPDTGPGWHNDKPSYNQSIMVPPRNGDTSRVRFTAMPDGKYTAYVMNFGPQLAFQAGLPFDGVYYGINCGGNATAVPHAEMSPQRGYEPSEIATGVTWVTNDSSHTARSKWERTFWYEEEGNDEYDEGVDIALANGMDSPGTLTDFPPDVDSIRRSSPTTINGARKRICVSLRLYEPTPSTSIVRKAVDCQPVEKKPYFRVTHGDVNAAASLSSPTCIASTGRVSAFNRQVGGSYMGSRGDIGVYSARQVFNFTSGIAPKGLTFANSDSTNVAANSTYGGGFRQTYCIPSSYWDNPTASGDRNTACSGADISTTGNIFITAVNCIPVNTVGIGNVPNLRKVTATGNIYISKNLENLDGIFIAQGDIYTCSESLNTPVTVQNMVTQCNRQLKIRGALIAGGTVKLQRTFGSLLGAEAETIEYNPFVWLSAINPVDPLSRTGGNRFDYITALPPVL